jgi:ubiquinone/menaquinone biosynthesis C-methylase UbiE
VSEKLSLDEIREFWTRQAVEHGQSAAASWSDHRVIELEIAEIVKRLEDGDRVLDVGCANGFSTVQLAAQRRIAIKGLDYIPEMIEQARQRLSSLEGRLLGKVEFGTGDIASLKEPDGSWDKVVVVRVVINLGEWKNQLAAILECARVLRKGGLLLLSEATLQGWRRMNAFRREWGLPDIPMPAFNNYLDQDEVAKAVEPRLRLVEISNFASTYFVGTRVLKPLLDRALGGGVNVASPDMEWNRWFAQLPAAGDYGTQKLFVFEKK